MRLIDADALYDIMNGQNTEFSLIDALAIIEEFPSIDAVPIVRCIDCVNLGFKDFRGYCEGGPVCGFVEPDSFCSWGRRKKNED